MAVTLTIDLSDAEEAALLDAAGVVVPGATPAQIKAWAEERAKLGLFDYASAEVSTHYAEGFRSALEGSP